MAGGKRCEMRLIKVAEEARRGMQGKSRERDNARKGRVDTNAGRVHCLANYLYPVITVLWCFGAKFERSLCADDL